LRRAITNPELLETIRYLKVKARENEAKIWEVAAKHLSHSKRTRSVLDLNHLARATSADSLILVPGKVLGSGSISHSVVVGAFDFSGSARTKIERAGGKCLGIKEFVNRYPHGSNVRIMR